jgi:hypothetical protein
MQYLHDNLKMHTIYGGKMQYLHYDLNPHYMWELKCNTYMRILKMHICMWGQNVILTL